MNNNITIHKKLEFPALTLGNIIVDGLLSFGYSFHAAQIAAEDILAGDSFYNKYTGVYINRRKVLQSIQRYCAGNTDIEIEMCSDNARDILLNIV